MPKTDWIRFTRESFATDEDWECLCAVSNCDPDETEAVKVYIADVEVE